MRVCDPAQLELFTDDHPTGALAQRYLFQGEDGSPDNYMFSIAETIGHFAMVRHRHNFDQFRFPLSGNMSMGADGVLREGHLGYFPEGASYGPQDDQAGPVALVLQFGGASGYGYLSPQQYRAGRAALNKVGRFEGAVFVRADGDGRTRRKFSINAIWEEALGERLLLPAPRYDRPIFVNPRAFRWVPVRGRAGVHVKHLGTFSERQAGARMWRLDPAASATVAAAGAIRLLFVLDGAGTAGGHQLGRHFAVALDPDEDVTLTAGPGLTLLEFALPLVGADWAEPEVASVEPMPEEAVAPAGSTGP